MEKAQEKARFEEQTRCPECNSDKIYAFQDMEGGICTRCKAIIYERTIKGGLSMLELNRMYGLIPVEETVNERDRKEEATEKARQDVVKLKSDVANLNKSTVMPAVPAGPKEPSLVEKAKAWLFKHGEKSPERPKTPVVEEIKRKEEPKIAHPKPREVASPPPPPPSTVKETGLPATGQLWSVGPCPSCRLPKKIEGAVTRSKASGTSARFIEISSGHYGCFFCAKKL